MRRVLLALLAAAGCGHGAAAGGPGGALPPSLAVLTPQQIAERATPSVVLIKTPNLLGTGFVVWDDGRIATNLHVIAGAREATITLHDGREFKDVSVLAVDRERNLAILRIPVKGLPVLPLMTGEVSQVKPGQHIVAIGHPLGLGDTVSDGLVSAVRVLDPNLTVLQITAPIAPGSSGGPILDEHGVVIGVATAFSSEGQNLNFGVPVSYLKPMLLAEQATPLASFSQGVDMGLLEGCNGGEVELTITGIQDAISVGVPLFNAGKAQACYEVYEKASLDLVGKIKGCPGVRETLLGGLTNANHAGSPSDKAWALRHAFDRILAAFEQVKRQVAPHN